MRSNGLSFKKFFINTKSIFSDKFCIIFFLANVVTLIFRFFSKSFHRNLKQELIRIFIWKPNHFPFLKKIFQSIKNYNFPKKPTKLRSYHQCLYIFFQTHSVFLYIMKQIRLNLMCNFCNKILRI